VSGSGSSFVQGKAKNIELFEKVAEATRATSKGVAVTGIKRVAYANAKWRLGDGEAQRGTNPSASTNTREDILNSLERLKDLRDRGVITDQEFETKKKELLDQL
jgi:Short C-terminal domain